MSDIDGSDKKTTQKLNKELFYVGSVFFGIDFKNEMAWVWTKFCLWLDQIPRLVHLVHSISKNLSWNCKKYPNEKRKFLDFDQPLRWFQVSLIEVDYWSIRDQGSSSLLRYFPLLWHAQVLNLSVGSSSTHSKYFLSRNFWAAQKFLLRRIMGLIKGINLAQKLLKWTICQTEGA